MHWISIFVFFYGLVPIYIIHKLGAYRLADKIALFGVAVPTIGVAFAALLVRDVLGDDLLLRYSYILTLLWVILLLKYFNSSKIMDPGRFLS